MDNNDPHKRRKKINHEKEKKESKQKKKENHEKGNFPSLEPFFCLLVFGQDKIQRGRERERALARTRNRERDTHREHARTSERTSETVREQSRSVCRSGFACFGHEFWGVNKRQFGRERGRGREEVLGVLTWLPYR